MKKILNEMKYFFIFPATLNILAIMIVICFFIVLFSPKNFTSIIASSEKSAPVSTDKSYTEKSYDEVIDVWLNLTLTTGNHSYVQINIIDLPTRFHGRGENPHNYYALILDIINGFEKKHPELEVPPGAWKIEKQQGANNTPNKIFGLWIDHRPRLTKAEPEPAK